LKVFCLKAIGKHPSSHIDVARLDRAQKIMPSGSVDSFDVVQGLVDYITEAGKFGDDVLPPSIFTNARSPRLELSLSNSKVTSDYIARTVVECPQLQQLNLSGCFQVSDATIALVGRVCPNLCKLDVRNCRRLTDEALASLCGRGPATEQAATDNRPVYSSLTALNLGGVVNLSHAGILSFLQSFDPIARLVELHVSGTALSDETLQVIGKQCKALTRLSIGFADVSEGALRKMLDVVGRRLEQLNISWLCTTPHSRHAPLTVDFFVDFLPHRCCMLQDVDVSGHRNVSMQCLAQYVDTTVQLAENFPKEARAVKVVRCKFVQGPMAPLAPAYPNVQFVC